jgi:2,3-bisphosphoglycerate-dependent phosphoglycerate mutase
MSRPSREVWFIRHGESVANAGGRTTEAATYPLSALGLRQAEQLVAKLPEPDLIIHSTYHRARQTAEPAIRRFAATPVEAWPVQEVQYLDPALCVGTTQDERRLMAIEYWRRRDPLFSTPGAESFTGFIGRVRDALDTLARRREQRVLVFSHGHFMKAIAWLIRTQPAELDAGAMSSFWQFVHEVSVPNCAILPLRIHDGAHSHDPIFVPDEIEREAAPDMPVEFTGL